MSTSIEQRIVEMKFDNAAFSKGVDSTIQDLDKLDKATKFEGGKNGLKQLQVAADQVNFKQVLSGIEGIQDSLNHMQSLGFQVFESLTRRAVDWGINMVKSLSVDQIAGGFNEYELKMDSIKTIMNSSGEKLDVVKEKLNELNTYSDKTIYSFSDMTSSIGKFTNSGVKLDAAVSAIQGISNQAALAGANAENASHAMYNFAQALSSGSVKLVDWRSIETANMATVDFKQSLIDTAVALGTVVETEEGYKSTTTDANGKVSDLFTSTLGFNDALSSQWMTTEVLTQTLQNYATDTREMTEAEREKWVEDMKQLNYTEEQIKRIEELGQKSFDAAQEVTTYSKMIDALREAVGSGWAQTFEILFGDLEEATKLWTGINDVIGGVIASVADTRNGILEMWKAGGGHTYLIAALKNIYNMFKNVSEYIGLALETLFGHRVFGNFEKVQKFFADRQNFSGNLVVIQRMSALLVNIAKGFWKITTSISKYFNPKLKDSQKRLSQIYLATQAFLVPLRGVVTILTGIAGKALPVVAKAVGIVASVVLKALSLIGAFFTVGGFQGKIYAFANMIVKVVGGAFDAISKVLDGVWTVLSKTFLNMNLDAVLGALNELAGVFEKAFGKVQELAINAYNAVCQLIDSFAQLFGYATIEDMFADIAGTVENNFNGAVSIASDLISGLAAAFELLWGFVEPFITNVGNGFVDWINGIGEAFETNPLMKKFTTDLQALGTTIETIFSKDTKLMTKSPTEKFNELLRNGYSIEAATQKIENMSGNFTGLGGAIDYAIGKFDDFRTAMSNIGLFSSIKTIFNDLIAAFKQTNVGRILSGTFGPIIQTIKDTFKDFKLGDTFGGMGAALSEFFNNLKTAMANAPDIPTFFNSIKTSLSVLYETIKSVVGPKFQEFLELIAKLKQALNPKEALPDGQEEAVSQSVIGMIQGFLSGLVKGIVTFDWGKVMSLLTVVLGLKFMKTIYNFLNGLSLVTKGFTGLGKTVKKFAKNITDLVGAAKWQIMADSIFRIATALVMLAGAIFVLSLIPKDNLQNAITALGAVTIFAVILMVVHGLMQKLNSAKEEAEKTKKVSETIKDAISGFVDKMKDAVSKFLKIAGIAAVIIAVAVAIGLIAKVLLDIAKIPWPVILKGLFWTSLIAAMLAAVVAGLMYAAKKFDPNGTAKLIPMAVMMYAFAKSLQKVAKVVATLGGTDDSILWKGMFAMGLLAAGLAGLMIVLTKFAGGESIKQVSTGMLLLAAALTILIIPITAFALLPFANLLQGLFAIAALIGALFALVAITKFMKTASIGLKELGTTLFAFVGVAVALFIFAQAIKVLTDQGEQIKKYAGMLVLLAVGFAVFAGVLGGIGYFLGEGLMMVGTGMLFFGLGLLAAAAAVWVFAQACVVFANGMDAIVNAVSGREAEVVNAISTIIAAAIKGIFEGLALALVAIIEGLDNIASSLRAHLPGLIVNLGLLLLECLGAIIQAVFIAIGEVFVWIYQKVDEAFPMFWARVRAGWASGWRTFLALILTMIAGVFEGFPVIGSKVAGFLEKTAADLIDTGKEKSDEILEAAAEEIAAKTESDVVPAAEESAQATKEAYERPFGNTSDKLTGFMDETKQKIKEGTPEVVAASEEAGQEVADAFDPASGMQDKSGDVMAFINQFAGEAQMGIDGQQLDFTGMFNGWPAGVAAGGDEANAQLQQYMEQMGVSISEQDYSEEGMASIQSYYTGMAGAEGEATATAEEISDATAEGLKSGDAEGSGKNYTQSFATGMRNNKSASNQAAKDVASEARSSADTVANSQEVKDVGIHFNQGLANGMSNNQSIVTTAAAAVMRAAMNSAKAEAVIKSPSKKMEEVGYFWDAGLALGIFKNGKMIFNTVTDTMKEAISKVKQSMAEMSDAINDSDLDFNPVITPVVDSDEAVRKLRSLNDILSGGTRVTMKAAARNASYDRQAGLNGTNNVTNNSNVSYVQNITSPRALRSRDIYRQTKNLIAVQKGARA